MTIYRYDGVLYNLDQVVSISDGVDPEKQWVGGDGSCLLLQFSDGRDIVRIPASERERIERLLFAETNNSRRSRAFDSSG